MNDHEYSDKMVFYMLLVVVLLNVIVIVTMWWQYSDNDVGIIITEINALINVLKDCSTNNMICI
jgi:hypothetical protein